PSNEFAQAIVKELDHFQHNFKPTGGAQTLHTQLELSHEPFVGYAIVQSKSAQETTLLICRHYTPSNLTPAAPNTDYVSYLAPLGRIIAKEPGEEHIFDVRHPRHRELVLEDHHYRLIGKDQFRPQMADGNWDGLDNNISWIGAKALVPSLRQLLRGITEPPRARRVRIKVQLPDQAILDADQDNIFRLPINRRVRISGAPGTGKTTVLLKRLSQKTKFDFLNEEEQQLFSKREWAEGQNWMLFTPNDLLKAYLKEALAKEFLPAGDDHVKVYGTFRLQVLRDIGFLRVGDRGFFRNARDDQQLLKRFTGSEHVSITKAFAEYFAARI